MSRDLALRFARHLAMMAAAPTGPSLSDVYAVGDEARFTVTAKDGQRVRVTVEDISLASTTPTPSAPKELSGGWLAAGEDT